VSIKTELRPVWVKYSGWQWSSGHVGKGLGGPIMSWRGSFRLGHKALNLATLMSVTMETQ
jgi:hypothetical protein